MKGRLTWESGYAHNTPFLLSLTLTVANWHFPPALSSLFIIPVFLHLFNFVYTVIYSSKYDFKSTTYCFTLNFPSKEFVDNMKTLTEAWFSIGQHFSAYLCCPAIANFINFSYKPCYLCEICYGRSPWLQRVVIKHSNGSKTMTYRISSPISRAIFSVFDPKFWEIFHGERGSAYSRGFYILKIYSCWITLPPGL